MDAMTCDTGADLSRSEDGEGADRAMAEAGLARMLAGFGVGEGGRRDALIDRLLARGGETRDPARLLEAAEAELRAWAAFVLGPPWSDHDAVLVLGRTAYRACRGAERWPECLLAYDVPDAFVRAMREAIPPPVPPEEPATMAEQRLEGWLPAEPTFAARLDGLLGAAGRRFAILR